MSCLIHALLTENSGSEQIIASREMRTQKKRGAEKSALHAYEQKHSERSMIHSGFCSALHFYFSKYVMPENQIVKTYSFLKLELKA